MPSPHICAAFASLLFLIAPVLPASADNHIDGLILTVESASNEPIFYTLASFDDMAQTEISTSNEFVSGLVTYSGPLARELVAKVGGDPQSTVVLTATNDYQISVPAKDFFDYDVVLATRMDGEILSRRDKGPIWLMYPISSHAELRDSSVNSKLIWQLVKMEVR